LVDIQQQINSLKAQGSLPKGFEFLSADAQQQAIEAINRGESVRVFFTDKGGIRLDRPDGQSFTGNQERDLREKFTLIGGQPTPQKTQSDLTRERAAEKQFEQQQREADRQTIIRREKQLAQKERGEVLRRLTQREQEAEIKARDQKKQQERVEQPNQLPGSVEEASAVKFFVGRIPERSATEISLGEVFDIQSQARLLPVATLAGAIVMDPPGKRPNLFSGFSREAATSASSLDNAFSIRSIGEAPGLKKAKGLEQNVFKATQFLGAIPGKTVKGISSIDEFAKAKTEPLFAKSKETFEFIKSTLPKESKREIIGSKLVEKTVKKVVQQPATTALEVGAGTVLGVSARLLSAAAPATGKFAGWTLAGLATTVAGFEIARTPKGERRSKVQDIFLSTLAVGAGAGVGSKAAANRFITESFKVREGLVRRQSVKQGGKAKAKAATIKPLEIEKTTSVFGKPVSTSVAKVNVQSEFTVDGKSLSGESAVIADLFKTKQTKKIKGIRFELDEQGLDITLKGQKATTFEPVGQITGEFTEKGLIGKGGVGVTEVGGKVKTFEFVQGEQSFKGLRPALKSEKDVVAQRFFQVNERFLDTGRLQPGRAKEKAFSSSGLLDIKQDLGLLSGDIGARQEQLFFGKTKQSTRSFEAGWTVQTEGTGKGIQFEAPVAKGKKSIATVVSKKPVTAEAGFSDVFSSKGFGTDKGFRGKVLSTILDKPRRTFRRSFERGGTGKGKTSIQLRSAVKALARSKKAELSLQLPETKGRAITRTKTSTKFRPISVPKAPVQSSAFLTLSGSTKPGSSFGLLPSFGSVSKGRSAFKIDSKSISIPKISTGTFSLSSPKSTPGFGTISPSSFKLGTPQRQNVAIKQAQKTIQSQKIKQKQITDSDTIFPAPVDIIVPDVPPPPTTPGGGLLFGLPEFDPFRTKKKKKKGKKSGLAGTFKPSLVGVDLFKRTGFTIAKAPKITSGIGLRPVVAGTFKTRI
jgi:hypothetical protein